MKISISALSIAYGLSSEALRYYEEKGLLTPERTSSSGFRKFSREDVQRLGIIKSLQKQGFSLDEIKQIMSDCTRDRLVEMMDNKRKELQAQVDLSFSILNRITASTDILRDADRLNMVPRLCNGCAVYLSQYESVAALWQSVPHCDVLRSLIDALPLTSYCTIVPLAQLQGDDEPLRLGLCAPAEYAAAIRADFSKLRMSAGPRSVRILFELIPPSRSSIAPVVTCAREFIEQNGLTPVSDGYTRQYVWFVDEKGLKRQYSELVIPVM